MRTLEELLRTRAGDYDDIFTIKEWKILIKNNIITPPNKHCNYTAFWITENNINNEEYTEQDNAFNNIMPINAIGIEFKA